MFGLLLPLGYEYDPSLVLLVRMPDSGMCDSVWQQLTGLLQGLAQGHTLVLMQVRRLRQDALNCSSLASLGLSDMVIYFSGQFLFIY